MSILNMVLPSRILTVAHMGATNIQNTFSNQRVYEVGVPSVLCKSHRQFYGV